VPQATSLARRSSRPPLCAETPRRSARPPPGPVADGPTASCGIRPGYRPTCRPALDRAGARLIPFRPDAVALPLGEREEDVQHQPARVRARVQPVLDRDEPPARRLDPLDRRQPGQQRRPKRLTLRHHDPLRDPGLNPVQRLLQQRTVSAALRTRRVPRRRAAPAHRASSPSSRSARAARPAR
jgi:hypothetical protein